jgi:isopentenyl-diphosphate delta-isomerase
MIFLIRSDGRVLIQRRNAERETFPDCYDSSCSFHVKFGEGYEEAAKRELIEEVGISAPLTYLGKISHYDPPENEVVAVFACYSDETIRSNKNEFSMWSFLTKAEVDKVVRLSAPWLRDGWELARGRL